MGLEVTTYQGGSQKTMYSPFVPNTKEQKQQIMQETLELWADFKQVVIASRGNVDDQFMQGQSFTGVEALQLKTNLVDGLCNSLAQIVGVISQQ
jgi:ClpP class serine protease